MPKKVSVSLLDAPWENLKETVKTLKKNNFNSIHMDVMDGYFVQNLSFGPKFCHEIKKIDPSLYVEAHLMVNDPFKSVLKYLNISMDAIMFHFEAVYYREIKTIIKDIKAKKIKAGIVLNPQTNIEQIYEYLDLLDVVLIMSVVAGKGGQQFMESSIAKIKKLSEYRESRKLSFEILVDGGINPSTATKCINAGADRYVVGSYIFRNGIENSAKDFEKIEK